MLEQLQVLKVAPGSGDSAIEVEGIHLGSPAAPYIACALLINDTNSVPAVFTELSGTGISVNLHSSLQCLIHQIRHPAVPVHLWIDRPRLGASLVGESINDQTTLSPKDIYRAAQETIIWAGDDHEASDEDCFDALLKPGNPTTTAHAFEFATRLAEPGTSDIARLLDERFPTGTNAHSWAYLFRILCRPFFRGVPLLRTNYASELPRTNVLCGRARIPLLTLQQAAHRIWAIFPVPHFIKNLEASSDDADGRDLMTDVDRAFVLSCIRFGFDPFTIYTRLNSCFTYDRETKESKEPPTRFFAHLGFCQDIYDFKGNEKLLTRPSKETWELEPDPTAFIDKALARSHTKKPPSLPFDGYMPYPPRAEEQAPYVHRYVNRGTKIRLLQLLPASSIAEPLQCGIIEEPIGKCPQFNFVTNNTFLRRKLQTIDFHGVQFSVPNRTTIPIIVNGQAFVIPRLQEIFLKLIRSSEVPVHLFLWNMCMYPNESGIETRKNVREYVSVKHFMKVKLNASEIDMYAVLENGVKERTQQDLEDLGLRPGLSWDEWLLELND